MTKNTAGQAGSIAWITGASSGIGAQTAQKLAAKGWHVAITARSSDKLAAMAAANDRLHVFAGDVTDPAAMTNIVADIENRLGPIDLAVLNAGTYLPDGLEDFNVTRFHRQYDVNVNGTANALAPVLERFRARGKGHIAIIASVAGYRGLPRSLGYGSTKAALINFCEALAIECADSAIKVQLVCPGFVKTPLTDKNDFPMPFLMPVERAAEKLVKGLESRRFEITFPWIFAFMLKMVRLLPHRFYIRMAAATRPAANAPKDKRAKAP